MATTKKKKKKSTGKRRVGHKGKGGEVLMMLIGVAVGNLGGRFIAGFQTFVKGILLGVIQIGTGVFIAYKAKSPMIKGLGVGLATNGLTYSLGSKGLALLPASVGEVSYFPQPMKVAGYSDVPQVGRFPSPSSVGNTGKQGPNMMNRNDYMSRIYGGVYTRN